MFSYLGSDGLGSAEVAQNATGNPQASVLYGPYGNARYSNGTMPGSYGFTGQHADATTGLGYYHARYYDLVAGQFASADSVQDGLNRYAYVGGNPETAADPSGHRMCETDTACNAGGSGSGGSGSGSGGSGPSGGTHPTSSCGGCKLSSLYQTGFGDSGSPSDDPARDAYGPCGHTRICVEGDDPNGLLDLAGYHHSTLIAFGKEGLDLLIGAIEYLTGQAGASLGSYSGGGGAVGTGLGCAIGAAIGALAFGVGAAIGVTAGWGAAN